VSRYIHWLLPFVMPAVLIGHFRLLVCMAGGTWNPEMALAFAVLIGGGGGAFFALQAEETRDP
jgi:hypothetical protein